MDGVWRVYCDRERSWPWDKTHFGADVEEYRRARCEFFLNLDELVWSFGLMGGTMTWVPNGARKWKGLFVVTDSRVDTLHWTASIAGKLLSDDILEVTVSWNNGPTKGVRTKTYWAAYAPTAPGCSCAVA